MDYELILDLYKKKCIKFGKFTLKSGEISPIYIDLKAVISHNFLINKIVNSLQEKIKFIDLFCGLGAFHEAFKKSKKEYECVFACDINENVRRIYEENHCIKTHGDINKIDINKDIPDFDILCAGFPCQPFSIAGKKEGFNDKEKGNLFYNILDTWLPLQLH